MKRFEAIDEEIEYLEILSSSENKKLLSELKQIRDEHSEMVWMLVKVRDKLYRNGFLMLPAEIETLLNKINDKKA